MDTGTTGVATTAGGLTAASRNAWRRDFHHGRIFSSHRPARPIGKAIVTPMNSPAIRNSHRSGKLSENSVLPAFTSSAP